ncbi:MAG: AgmX/PglI C-terminal domain-containing protein [Myxococcota bacterium]
MLQFILRSGSGTGNLGVDTSRRKVLEVNQIWGQTLIDTKHFSRTMGDNVTIGSSVGWKWHFLGIDMGWIPSGLHMVLPYTPPMWSEVASDWRNDFYASDQGLPGRDHALFELEDEEYTAKVLDNWDGYAEIGGQRFSFEELVRAGKARKEGQEYAIPMTDDVRLMVNADGVVFFGHMVQEGQRILQRSTEDTDYPFLAILSFMTFLGVMFGLVMFFSPKPAGISVAEYQDRFANIQLDKPDLDKKKDKPKADPDAGEGEKAKKKEGKVGKKKAKKQKAKGNKIDIKRAEQDRLVAENAGIASSLDGMLSDSRINPDLAGNVGGLLGVKGSQAGAGGLGSRGSGLGGGGSAEGIGGLGTRGRGAGRSGFGKGGGDFGAKGQGGLGRVGGDPIILGALDRSLIDEVIKRNMNKIKYCYQRELTKNPALQGKIVIKFTIAKDGGVAAASKKSTTMNNASVEQCIVSQFMRMRFPEPKGGGIVIVSYPFLFSPG